MKKRMLRSIYLAIALVPCNSIGGENRKRPITVEDCIRTRRIVMEEVRLSPGGDQVAYLVKAPDVTRNANVFQLYVRDLRGQQDRNNGRMLFAGESVRGIRWSADSKGVLFLTTEGNNKSRIVKVTVASGKLETITEVPFLIEEFTASAMGDTVIFSVFEKSTEVQLSPEDVSKGYPIVFGQTGRISDVRNPRTSRFHLYLVKNDGKSPSVISELNLQDEDLLKSPVRNLRNLNLSPDGRFLVFHCKPEHLPADWLENPVVRGFLSLGQNPPILVLYELKTGRIRLAINAPDPHYQVMWSDDSKGFAVNSVVPIESIWEKQRSEPKDDSFKTAVTDTHIFAVKVDTGEVSLVLKTPVSDDDLPLSWKAENGSMMVRVDSKTIAEMKRKGNEWGEASRFTGEVEHYGNQYPGLSDGQIEIDSMERPSVPPDLTRSDLGSGKTTVLTDLNPEYKDIERGDVEKVEWKNQYEAICSGYLIKPVGYKRGAIYPLVIMAKGWTESFLSDTTYRTAFPPQVLANSGFMVLLANPPSFDKEPKGYPGQMGEAFNFMAMIESAVTVFSSQGLIDKNQVGIIGFSRTSWLLDFMLTHSKVKFAAASSADSGAYNYGAYWDSNDERLFAADETQYGGPPYGESFQSWLKYAPAFNAQNVTAPILMEYTQDWLGTEPISAYEFFVALRRQGKPADLFYYPKGEHELDTPAERVASLQRNVDWFRFWIQGYERPDPEASTQYARWRSLKALQANRQASAAKPH
jgi:dipeptidyl aminopeptidase/acylaminoacyl peptidase